MCSIVPLLSLMSHTLISSHLSITLISLKFKKWKHDTELAPGLIILVYKCFPRLASWYRYGSLFFSLLPKRWMMTGAAWTPFWSKTYKFLKLIHGVKSDKLSMSDWIWCYFHFVSDCIFDLLFCATGRSNESYPYYESFPTLKGLKFKKWKRVILN